MTKLMSLLVAATLSAAPVASAAPDTQPTDVKAVEGAATQPAEQDVFKTQKEKLSYTIGMNIGNSFKRESLDIDVDILSQAIKDVLSGKETLLTEDQARKFISGWQQERTAQRRQRQKELGEKNKKQGDAFLAENKKKEGILTLPSGLQYKVIKSGTGASPKRGDMVTVHYRGTLIDGTEFDSSHERGKPSTLRVGGVIKGWTEALQLMKVGGKWKLFIPPELAYGGRGSPRGKIGPNATLIFDVELLSIQPPATQPKQARSQPRQRS